MSDEKLIKALATYGGIKFTQRHIDEYQEPKKTQILNLLAQQEKQVERVIMSGTNSVDTALRVCQKSLFDLL